MIALVNILNEVALFYGVSLEDMKGRSRAPKYVRPRHMAMYLCYEMTDATYEKIGALFNRDYSTVIYVRKKIKDELERYADTQREAGELKRILRGYTGARHNAGRFAV